MPKRTDIHKVLIIGSGPIIIGQACEFDYSGTQACKALKKLGYEIVLVNSNPATIMTDPETADVTYIEPLNVERLEQIIAKERPDALLPNLGGQSGLNLCAELNKAGVLDKYGVKVIGVQVDAIERGEDRIEFKRTMDKLGIEMARSEVAYSVDEALAIADRLGYPVVLRPAYTMGGAGGGLVYNREELKIICERGLQASLVGQVLVEESVLGWEELELEVVRDAENNIITVCFIENIDPLGVHTGDSFCSAPMLTISEDLQKRLQEQAYKIVESVQVIGGTNVQFAHDPVSDRIIVIESDTVIVGDLAEIYGTDFEGAYAICPGPEHKPRNHRDFMEKIRGDCLTFVLSMYDVERIRRDFTLEDILNADAGIRKLTGNSMMELTFGLLFAGRIKYIPARTACIDENERYMEELGYDHIAACEKTAKIIHFSSYGDYSKPWNPVFLVPGYREWWKYAADSPYYKEYIQSQWQYYNRTREKQQQIAKNVTYRNILLCTIGFMTLLLMGLCLVSDYGWAACLTVPVIAVVSFGLSLFVRRISMAWGKDRRK